MIRLHYWPGRGRMEVARLILAIVGKFPEDGYENCLYTTPPDIDCMKFNLGRMPVMEVGNVAIGESLAIWLYLALEHDMLGSSHLDGAKIIEISETVNMMMDCYLKLVPYGPTTLIPEQTAIDTWFEPSCNTLDSIFYWMSRLESLLNQQAAVGYKLSLGDVILFSVFGDSLQEEETNNLPKYHREPFTDKNRVDEALGSFPKLSNAIELVAKHPNVQKWLSMRGIQSG